MHNHHIAIYEIADQSNIAELLDRGAESFVPGEAAKEWIKAFMFKYGAWFTELEKDHMNLLRSMPATKLQDFDECKKFLITYFKTAPHKLAKSEKPGRAERVREEEKPEPVHVDIPAEAQKIIKSTKSKAEAMYLLSVEGYENKKIAEFMGSNPGLVGSCIAMHRKKIKK